MVALMKVRHQTTMDVKVQVEAVVEVSHQQALAAHQNLDKDFQAALALQATQTPVVAVEVLVVLV